MLLDKLITAGIGAGLMGIMYLAWLLSGAFGVAYSENRVWSWRRFWEDLLKLLLRLGGVTLYIVGCELVEWYAGRLGADITAVIDSIGSAGVIMLVFKATLSYAEKAFANFSAFLSKQHNPNLEIEINPNEIDWAGIGADVRAELQAFAEAITPKHLQTDEQTDDEATITEAELAEIREAQAEGKGGEINPLNRILPDGDNDGGKGWQCSKYAGYLATGKRIYSTAHPDYGPVNGRDMVDYLIKNLGFIECAKQDGAIFSYNVGAYGHTGIVKDARNNIVNDANWTPLRVGTHYLNLEAVGAKYCCLPSQKVVAKPAVSNTVVKPATTTPATAAPKPSVSPTQNCKPLIFRKGEKVVPLRKIDYDGRHLRQYDDVYYIVQDVEEGCDRVVLGARGQVWAALRAEDVRKV